MAHKNEDLHGFVPDKSQVALLVIDVINDLEFDGGDQLLLHAMPMAESIAQLKQRAKAAGIPVIYVNDNYGKWRSKAEEIIEHCLRDDVRGREIVKMLKPEEDDYFVIKPKHSGFFSTTLATLLEYLGAQTLILTGMAGNICILFTANDAYMRDYYLVVPEDCTASNEEEDNKRALKLMKDILKAETMPSGELDLEKLITEKGAKQINE